MNKPKMLPQERVKWTAFKNKNLKQIGDKDMLMIAGIYARLYNKKLIVPCKSDGRLWRTWINQIDKVYNS